MKIQKIALLLLTFGLLAIPVLLLATQQTQNMQQKAAGTGIPSFSHIFVIMYENHSYSEIIGSSTAPYINSLTNKYGLATNFLAIAHPSLPNYIAFTSGGTQGITSDCNTCFISATNIFSELEAAGKTWRSYHETMPGNCALSDSGSYVLHHNPAAYYLQNRSSCSKNDVPYSQFAADLASGNIGNFNFIVPNNSNNMHSGTIQAGDSWLHNELPKILSSSAFLNNGVVFFTFDEGNKSLSPNQIVTIVISPLVKMNFKSNVSYTLYSLLRTIEDGLGVMPIGAAANATPMADFFGVSTGTTITPKFIQPTGTTTPTPAQSANTIIIKNMQFSPPNWEIDPGTTITWVNQDTIAHTTTSDIQQVTGVESWDSGDILPGRSFSHTFTTAGSHAYHCKLHPTMKGIIQVRLPLSITPFPTCTLRPPCMLKTPSQCLTPPPIPFEWCPISGTPSPSISHIPTPTFAPGEPVILLLDLLLHGIGVGGDNVNAKSGGNINPLHPDRDVTISLEGNGGGTGQQSFTGHGIIHYAPLTNSSGTGSFYGNVGIAAPNGSYILKIKPDNYLQKQAPGIVTLAIGNNTPISVPISPGISFITGDINNDNQLDILDYNLLINCFGSKQSTSGCTSSPTSQSPGADLDDNGVIDGVDYNLLLRELSVQKGI